MTSKASGRVLYLNPMDYGTNPGVDAIAHGLHHRLETSGLELRVVFNDFSRADWRERAASTIDAAIAAKFRAVVIYVLDPMEPAAAVARARKAGLQVFSFERPRFPVDGSLVYPNFNQGTYMAEHLAVPVRGKVIQTHDHFRRSEPKGATPGPLAGLFPFWYPAEAEIARAIQWFAERKLSLAGRRVAVRSAGPPPPGALVHPWDG